MTLVPLSLMPRQADRKPVPELLNFGAVDLLNELSAMVVDAEGRADVTRLLQPGLAALTDPDRRINPNLTRSS